MTTDIKNIYTSIVELYIGFDQLTPLQKIEQEEKIKSFIDNTFHQDNKKVSLYKTPANINSISPNNIKATADYSAESGEGFENGYVATYNMLFVNYEIQFGDNLHETIRLIHNGSMAEIDGEINSIKISEPYKNTWSEIVWYSYYFNINLRLTSISTIKNIKLEASLIGASTPKNSNSSCFIATAAFGHNDKMEVIKLSKFRDETLLNTNLGRHFIRIYKILSPPIADFIRTKPYLRKVVRAIIRKMVLRWV